MDLFDIQQLAGSSPKIKESIMEERWHTAKRTSVGCEIECPYCGKKITKKSWNHKFCSSDHSEKYWKDTEPKHESFSDDSSIIFDI